MSTERIMIILAGTLAMLILMLLRRKRYPKIPIWKYPVISLLLTIAGVAGTMLMFYIETGRFGGTSFFGAILFVPILMLPVCLLRIPYRTLMDLCAPAECMMLTIMKVDCLMSDCCIGKYLPNLEVQFPSQIIEMITVFFIMLLLVEFDKKNKSTGSLYGAYLILYGSTRFVLNWFRYGIKPFLLGLPAGNFWSLVAIALGIVWLWVINKKHAHVIV